MSGFSDDDLKRLKELLDKGDFQTIEVHEATCIWKQFRPLLARLEAAEQVYEGASDITEFIEINDCGSEHSERCLWWKYVLETWRKSKGE